MPQPDVYAVFIDVMGFASSIESLTEDEHAVVVHFLSGEQGGLPAGIDTRALNPKSAQVHGGYKLFHRAVNELLKRSRYAVDTNTLIAFSDSAYFITSDWGTAANAARQMMVSCFGNSIPLRIGIGRDSFVRLAFSTTAGVGGGLSVEAPFLGTAIVRAYRAQESGPGFRIFIHPSAAPAERDAWQCVNLNEGERSSNRAHELNYLARDDDQIVTLEGWLAGLNEMKRDSSGDQVPHLYEATEAAMRRMFASAESLSSGRPRESWER